MKRLLSVLLSIFICPLSAVIINGYKYKKGNKIIYLLAYDKEPKNIVNQVKHLKEKIIEGVNQGYIETIIVPKLSDHGFFYKQIGHTFNKSSINTLIINPFESFLLTNSLLFLEAMELWINSDQDKGPLIVEEIKKINLSEFKKELSMIDLEGILVEKLSENKSEDDFEILGDLFKNIPFVTIFTEKYRNFLVKKMYEEVQKYLSISANGKCMIAFVDNNLINSFLPKLRGLTIEFSTESQQKIRILESEKKQNELNNYKAIRSFFKKTDTAALTNEQIDNFFTKSTLEAQITKQDPIIKIKEEKTSKNNQLTTFQWLKKKAWEWKNALIPVAAAGLGIGYWWLKSRNKPVLSPSTDRGATEPAAEKV